MSRRLRVRLRRQIAKLQLMGAEVLFGLSSGLTIACGLVIISWVLTWLGVPAPVTPDERAFVASVNALPVYEQFITIWMLSMLVPTTFVPLHFLRYPPGKPAPTRLCRADAAAMMRAAYLANPAACVRWLALRIAA